MIYNNLVVFGTACSGGVNLWLNGNQSSPNSSDVGFAFGNVEYNTSGANLIDIGNHGAGNYGTYYVFNNTVDCLNGGCGGSLPVGPYWTIYDQNNHWIGSSYVALFPSGGTALVCTNGSGSGCTDIIQSESSANAQGYTSTQTYPYSPISSCTSSTCSTVQSGTNINQSAPYLLAQAVVGTAAAATACQNGTSVGCAYNATSHTLNCPNLALAARPSSAAWDVGAYQIRPPPSITLSLKPS